MKILFFDVKNIEYDYLKENISNKIESYFFKNSLDESTYIDEKHLNSQGISVFVTSQITKNVLAKFSNLKYIFLRCVGYSNIDLNYCKEKNIKVFNTPNYGNSTVAEYTFALLLTLIKKINKAQNSILKADVNYDYLRGFELFGKTIGIIGAGAIGRKVINIAHGFNMNVLVYDTTPKGAYNFVELDELLKKSDIISINCPLNESTKYMIDKIAISKMKKSVIIINTARGEIINTKDLYYALIENKIKGVALDVIECEEMLCEDFKTCSENLELKENIIKKFFYVQKLAQMDNVIITPHNAYNTIEAQMRILNITMLNIKSIFDKKSSPNNLVLI